MTIINKEKEDSATHLADSGTTTLDSLLGDPEQHQQGRQEADDDDVTSEQQQNNSGQHRKNMLMQLRELDFTNPSTTTTTAAKEQVLDADSILRGKRNNKRALNGGGSASYSEAIERLSNHGGFQFDNIDIGDSCHGSLPDAPSGGDPWQLGDPLHDPYLPWGHVRNTCGAWLNHTVTQIVSTLLIILNAAVLAALTFHYENPDVYHALDVTDTVILSLFTVELALQGFYLGLGPLVANGWLLFDLVVIVMSWAFFGSPVTVLRSLRILRIFALFSRWESMRHLVQAVGKTLPKMATIWIALLVFFFVFCVLFTDLYGDLFEDGTLDYDYFGRMDRTFLTLFQFMTLDSWSAVVRQVLEDRPASLIGFCCWIIITAFFMLNLVVAVICESLIELTNLKEKKYHNRALQRHRDMIAAQTAQLVEETERIGAIQAQMLQNQLLMQQALLQIAEHIVTNNTTTANESNGNNAVLNDASSRGGGKAALSRLLSSMEDDEDKEQE